MFACLLGVLTILVIVEALWQHKQLPPEWSRKIVHMSVGVFVAFWPWVLEWWQIRVIALAFIVVILISKQFKVFRAIHDVKRNTVGEIGFAMAILLSSYLALTPWQFSMAILIMAVADGLAALVGMRYLRRKGQRYTIFGCNKTWAGSFTFFLVTALIIFAMHTYFVTGPNTDLLLAAIIPMALILTVIEAGSAYGIDNISVPLAAILLARIIVL
jgi:dolichol kinase